MGLRAVRLARGGRAHPGDRAASARPARRRDRHGAGRGRPRRAAAGRRSGALRRVARQHAGEHRAPSDADGEPSPRADPARPAAPGRRHREQGALDRAAHALAHAVGACRPLVLPATVAAVWAWIGTAGEPDLAQLRAAMEDVDPAIRAAVGPSCPGLAGFRRSHDGAVATHGLVARARGGERLTTYRDVEVTTLVAQDPRRMTDFVRTTLGPLAGRDAAAARLRETLRIYLSEGESAPRAAQRLYTHRNTVLQRVARAEELLGHPIADRRLELALALELTHRLGERTLA